MPPPITVSVIPLECVMIVMISLAISKQRKKSVISSSARVAVRLASPNVGGRIYQISAMLTED